MIIIVILNDNIFRVFKLINKLLKKRSNLCECFFRVSDHLIRFIEDRVKYAEVKPSCHEFFGPLPEKHWKRTSSKARTFFLQSKPKQKLTLENLKFKVKQKIRITVNVN